MSIRIPNSEQKSYVMSSSCDDCGNGTIMVFNEEIGHLRSKLPFTCQLNQLVSSLELGTGKESTEQSTLRPGCPTLPDTREGPNNTTNRIRAGASSVVSTIEIGGLQRKSTNLQQAIVQLSRVNERLRAAVEACIYWRQGGLAYPSLRTQDTSNKGISGAIS